MHMSERAYTAQAGITGKPDAAWICWEMALQAELHLSNTPHRFQVVSLPSILHPILILQPARSDPATLPTPCQILEQPLALILPWSRVSRHVQPDPDAPCSDYRGPAHWRLSPATISGDTLTATITDYQALCSKHRRRRVRCEAWAPNPSLNPGPNPHPNPTPNPNLQFDVTMGVECNRDASKLLISLNGALHLSLSREAYPP